MLYLASQSPRRRQLLEQIGIEFRTIELDVPEIRGAGESAERYVSRVAREKARAGLATLADTNDAVVLGADTEVVLDDDVFGKPVDADDAAAMLRHLSDRQHRVLVGRMVCQRTTRRICAEYFRKWRSIDYRKRTSRSTSRPANRWAAQVPMQYKGEPRDSSVICLAAIPA